MTGTPSPTPAGDRPEEIAASRFLWLIGVFLAGFLLVVGLKAFFAQLQDELSLRSANERARLFVGEEIVHGIQLLETDVYQMTTLSREAALDRQLRRIDEHLDKLEADLKVLRHGGTVRRIIELNLEGRDQIAREVSYQPPADAGAYVMELIEIEPLLAQIHGKSRELRELMNQRSAARDNQDVSALLVQEQRINLFLKHLPPHFLRLHENANRLFYESGERLKALEMELDRQRQRYQLTENLLVVLVITLATLAGMLFAGQIRESNRRLRRAWEEMRAAKEEAERASRAKSEFVSRMSHELRTPMNAILGFAQLLDGEELEAEHRAFVNEINNAGEHLLDLINQVLDLAKIEAGSMTLESIEFDLMETVDQVATLVAERAREKGLDLRFFASPELPSRVLGDPTRLRQVLINLVGNAVKFTHQGSIELRVEPSADGEHIDFAILDTGIGMDAATLSRLFQPFTQADESTTRKYGGTGLGLMISRDLVRAMGGDIQVESNPGQGSRFRFSLPARPAPDAPPRPRPLAGYRAMMTCTEAYQLEAIGAQLQALGAEVLAACGPEALRQSIAEAPQRPWVFIGQAGCLGSLSELIRERPADLCLLLPGDGGAIAPERVDAVLAEPFTYSRMAQLIQDALRHAAGRHTTRAPTRTPSLAGHVLLVEDNRINRMVAGGMLSKLGIHHDSAENGREALEKLKTQSYDLVLMDMQMPEMDGVDATRAWRVWEAEQGRPALPIIAMTANALSEDRALCLASGMNDHLPKPVEIQRLAEVLRAWLPARPDAG